MAITRSPVLVVAALAVGCGVDTVPRLDPPPAPAPTPAPRPVGPRVVASGVGEQSEAVVAVAGAGASGTIVVQFNDFAIDEAFPGGPEYTLIDDGEGILARRGMSLMGYSVSTDGGATYDYRGKVRPPPGWSMISGDPAIAVDPGDPSIVYMTDLAISDVAWDAATGGKDELLNPSHHGDGVCVARSTDAGFSFPEVTCVARPPALVPLCTPGSSVCVDHTAVGVDGAGRLYVAAEIFHANGQHDAIIHVWRSPGGASWSALAPLPIEPPALMEIEPTIVTAADGAVWIAGATTGFPRDIAVNEQPAGSDDFRVAGYLVGNAGLSNYTGGFQERVVTAPDTSFRVGRTFTLAVGIHEEKPDIRVVYSAKRPEDKSFFLAALHCAIGLDPVRTCIREPAWETESWPGHQFMPTMSRGLAAPHRFDVAFLTSDGGVDVDHVIQVASFSTAWSPPEAASGPGVAAAENPSRLTPVDWPVCGRRSKANPLSNYNGYWGDYLGTAQGNDAAGFPFSVSAFSDSRAEKACVRGDKFADPLHVAAAVW